MPYKVFVAGEEALAADANTYLMSQTVPRFTNAAQRTSQLTAPVLNQLSMLDSAPGAIEYWTGSAWASTRELFSAALTANVTINAASAAASQTVIAGPATTFDGTPVTLEFFAPILGAPAVASGQVLLNIFDGSTDLGIWGSVAGNGVAAPVLLRRRITPTSGSHTFSVKGWISSAGTATVVAGAGGGAGLYQPGYLAALRS